MTDGSDTPKHRLWAPDNAEYMDVSDTPKRCPRCGSDDPEVRLSWIDADDVARFAPDDPCPDPFHQPASPRQGEAEGEERVAEYETSPGDRALTCYRCGNGFIPEGVKWPQPCPYCALARLAEAHSVGEDDALAEVKRLRAEVQLAEARADRAERNAIDWGHRLERAEEKR